MVRVLAYHLLIYFTQVACSLGSKFSNCIVAVKPAPTGTDPQTIEKLINCTISDIQGVYVIVQILIENVTISKSENNQMAIGRCLNEEICTLESI